MRPLPNRAGGPATCGEGTGRGAGEQGVLGRVEEATGTLGLARASLRMHGGFGSDTMRPPTVMSKSGRLGLAGGREMHGLPACEVEAGVRWCPLVFAKENSSRFLRPVRFHDAGAEQPAQLFQNGKRERDVELGHPVLCAVSGSVGCIADPCRARRQRACQAAWLSRCVTPRSPGRLQQDLCTARSTAHPGHNRP